MNEASKLRVNLLVGKLNSWKNRDEINPFLLDYVLSVGVKGREFLEKSSKGAVIGGYRLFQNPEEICLCIQYLLQYVPFDMFLEIGSAAGGTTRLLNEFLGFKKIFIVDDNSFRLKSLRRLLVPEAVEWTGNSHDPRCKEWLNSLGVSFDLVHIDGDHSYDGVTQDFEMIFPLVKKGGRIILHDIKGIEDVRLFWEDIRSGKYSKFGIVPEKEICVVCGIGIVLKV